MKAISHLQFFQRVARHRRPTLPVREVEHTCADDQAERRRDDSSMKMAALVFWVCLGFVCFGFGWFLKDVITILTGWR